MKRLIGRDIPPRATVAVVVLALLATLGIGREQPPPPAPAEVGPPKKPVEIKEEIELDPEKLIRPKREGDARDLFAGRSWVPSPPPAPPVAVAAPVRKPEPPPPPAAPPLPFRYVGRLDDGERTVVFLRRDQKALGVTAGTRVDDAYRVESISESAVEFVYLPLGTKQVLDLPLPSSRRIGQ
jgi:hypothetical protein